MPLVFGERLEGLSNEMLVEVRQRGIDLRKNIGRILIAIRVSPVVPCAGAEYAVFRLPAEDRGIARVPIAVQLIDSARLGRGQAYRRAVLVELLVPVPRRISLGIELPAVTEVGGERRILEIGLHVISVVTPVIRVRGAVGNRAVQRHGGTRRCAVEQVIIAEASTWARVGLVVLGVLFQISTTPPYRLRLELAEKRC